MRPCKESSHTKKQQDDNARIQCGACCRHDVVSPLGDSRSFRHSDIQTETNSIIDTLKKESVEAVVIDFHSIELVDSIMIGAIIKIARRHSVAENKAAFCEASPMMRRVLDSMNLTRMWPCFDSREDALRSFSG